MQARLNIWASLLFPVATLIMQTIKAAGTTLPSSPAKLLD
jgi:hypothetical protein